MHYMEDRSYRYSSENTIWYYEVSMTAETKPSKVHVQQWKLDGKEMYALAAGSPQTDEMQISLVENVFI